MTVKSQVRKHSENNFVLDRFGTMKVDVSAFLSQALFDSSDQDLWEQVYNSASYDGVVGAYLMPDTHLGYDCPIGCVVVTENTLIQSCNGFDISCGIVSAKIPGLSAKDIQPLDKRRQLINEIEKRAAMGKGSDRPSLMPKFSNDQVDDILRHGAKALGIDASLCERQFVPVSEEIELNKIEKAYSKVIPQLGSVGGGNHFIELQCDPQTGEVWVMIHCGSRGYGYQTANYFFHEGAKLRGLPDNRRETSFLYADEPLGKEYWDYCASAANFAIANRHIIVNGVNEALEEVFGVRATPYYEISHNLTQEETLVLPDGSTKKGFVHRKGATRAFPAGHPDLKGTIWESSGHPSLISGSMLTGAAILFPQEGAYRSGCSVNHGSGRVLGRKEAKRQLGAKQVEINNEMSEIVRDFAGTPIKGIVSNHRQIPLEECGAVYKNLDEVLDVLKAENIAKIKHRLFPIANLKGAD